MKTAEDVLNEKNRSIISVQAEETIKTAAKLMVKNKIGAIVIKEGDRIKGIYTERDLLRNSIEPNFNIHTAKIQNYASGITLTASFSDPIYILLDRILGKRIRHVFIEKEGDIIGILSAGDVTKACLNERTKELQSISLEYYENWRWKDR